MNQITYQQSCKLELPSAFLYWKLLRGCVTWALRSTSSKDATRICYETSISCSSNISKYFDIRHELDSFWITSNPQWIIPFVSFFHYLYCRSKVIFSEHGVTRIWNLPPRHLWDDGPCCGSTKLASVTLGWGLWSLVNSIYWRQMHWCRCVPGFTGNFCEGQEYTQERQPQADARETSSSKTILTYGVSPPTPSPCTCKEFWKKSCKAMASCSKSIVVACLAYIGLKESSFDHWSRGFLMMRHQPFLCMCLGLLRCCPWLWKQNTL